MWELDTTTWKWNKLGAKLHNKTCFHAAVVTKVYFRIIAKGEHLLVYGIMGEGGGTKLYSYSSFIGFLSIFSEVYCADIGHLYD